MRLLVLTTLCAWAAFEILLLARDRASGRGGTSQDRGTRGLTALAWFVAIVSATAVTIALRSSPRWQLGRWHLVLGLAVLLGGVAIRCWAVVELGASFRTTVEADAEQAVVEAGPYRWVRHPAYSGLLLVGVGAGLSSGNWIALAVLVLLPLAATLRRINVEEAFLGEAMGAPYLDYLERTKRLIPGIW